MATIHVSEDKENNSNSSNSPYQSHKANEDYDEHHFTKSRDTFNDPKTIFLEQLQSQSETMDLLTRANDLLLSSHHKTKKDSKDLPSHSESKSTLYATSIIDRDYIIPRMKDDQNDPTRHTLEEHTFAIDKSVALLLELLDLYTQLTQKLSSLCEKTNNNLDILKDQQKALSTINVISKEKQKNSFTKSLFYMSLILLSASIYWLYMISYDTIMPY